jgi:hypothetical protein
LPWSDYFEPLEEEPLDEEPLPIEEPLLPDGELLSGWRSLWLVEPDGLPVPELELP